MARAQAQQGAPAAGGATMRVQLRDVEAALPKFSGSDRTHPVQKWIEYVGRSANVYGLTPLQTLLAARTTLEGSAKLWLESVDVIRSWEEMKEALKSQFETQADSVSVHRALSRRKKNASETYGDYVLHMKQLGNRGSLRDSDIIQYILDGIQDDTVHKAALYGATTLTEFRTKLAEYERIKSGTEKSQGARPKPSQGKSVAPGAKDRGRHEDRRCYNCGESGHIGKDCRRKGEGSKCFKCQKYGHIAPNSPEATTGTGRTKKPATTSNKGEAPAQVMCVSSGSHNQCRKEAVVQGVTVDCLVDSGNVYNLMRADLLKKLGSVKVDGQQETLIAAGGGKVKTMGRVKATTIIDGVPYPLTYRVVPGDSVPAQVLLGADLLNHAVVKLSKHETEVCPEGDYLLQITLGDDTFNHIDAKHREEVRQLVEDYRPTGEEQAPVEMKIILTDETPISRNPRRLSPKEKDEVDQQIDEWLKDGVVVPSCSEFASPIVVARKKDGTARICVDFKPLNRVVAREHFPLPLIEDLLDKLAEAVVYATLDLKNGFFHVKVEEESRKYTSFVTPSGQYEIQQVPFGLTNSPAVFQRFITFIFRDLVREGILLTYLDDLIVMARDDDEAIRRLRRVLGVASRFGLEVNWKKCQLLCRRIEFLGHIVEDGTIRSSPGKTETLVNFPQPKTVKQVQRFLGLAGYFRKFVQGYAKVAKPLSDLLRKEQAFVFGEEQHQTFLQLKRALAAAPVLKIYNPKLETELHTDASQDGYGAITFMPVEHEHHPFHLHGQYFHVVAVENGNGTLTMNGMKSRNEAGLINKKFDRSRLKDTVGVPTQGFAVLRFVAENPGYWFFHCHVAEHLELGMAIVIKIGKHEEMDQPPPGFPKCGNYDVTQASDHKH